jgi:hypothetical protein
MRTPMMIAALMSLSLAACATDDTTYDGDVLPGPSVHKALCRTGCSPEVAGVLKDGDWIVVKPGTFARAESVQAGGNVCSSLPATGQCALACDPQKLVDTLPAGTCSAVHCALEAGDVVFGGCNTPMPKSAL